MIKKIKDLSENYFGEILDIRRHLHMYPELSFQEFETSKYIKDILNLWGINFIDGYVETGILVVLEGKNPNLKSLALRADFDALPINEKNRVEYCSKNEGVMHACGHDAHTACLLGALKILHSCFETLLKLAAIFLLYNQSCFRFFLCLKHYTWDVLLLLGILSFL